MIYEIRANKDTFKKITFKQGLNIILADKTIESDDKDSRNGIGKTSVIEIVHFCLGANFEEGKSLGKEELQGWEFELELDISNERCAISRSTSTPEICTVKGNFESWDNRYLRYRKDSKLHMPYKELNKLLDLQFFGIQPEEVEDKKYNPSFRALFSYFARRRKEAYNDPRKYFSAQTPWQIQVTLTYLMGLNWKYAREWQFIKDKEKEIKSLEKAISADTFSDIIGSLGELETKKLRIKSKAAATKSQLSAFQVHPQYKNIETEANSLTQQVHDLLNETMSLKRRLDAYKKNIKEDEDVSTDDIKTVYEKAGLEIPNMVVKRLDDAVNFHKEVIKNRTDYLIEEVKFLENKLIETESTIESLSKRKSELMNILNTHKALEEYNLLQQKHLRTVSEFENIERKIELIRKFEQDKSDLKISKENLKKSAQQDYFEQEQTWSKLITSFNEFSERLYQTPGNLVININSSGYTFDVEIQRAESSGVSLMKVFCFDFMLASFWTKKDFSPGFLIHDSSIFADVDERQIASALELSKEISEKKGFQYICCLNSDKVPANLLPEKFIKNHLVLSLKDKPESECLFGFRF